ncbi:MAG: pseudouridine synthase [Persicimonas sp.]
MADKMRVQKYLSKAGVCSRRKGEDLMQAGRVQVNGETCRELGSKVVPGEDEVAVDGEVVSLPDQYVYLLVNKPENYITTLDDPKGRPIVTDLIPDKMPRIWPVGRLDWDSSGALIMTNDGKLTNLLTHPSQHVTKQYAVKVRGVLKNDSSKLDRLREGIELDGRKTKPAHIEVTRDNGNNTWMEFIITEGRNRQIRRMCEAIGHPVMKLRRYAVGAVTLDGLPSGSYRPLLFEEVEALYDDVDTPMPERAKPSRTARKRERQRRKHQGTYDVRTHGPGKNHH